MSTTLQDPAHKACEEIATVFAEVPVTALETLAEEIGGARRIAVHGVGREGLMLRALAMRLYHLGLDASVVGDMTTPPLGHGDLLLASAGPGHFATVEALMGVARGAGARVALLTAQPEPGLGALAHNVVRLPARTMAAAGAGDAVLPMGSAYEGALFVFGELLVRRLRERLGADEAAMRARHTNLE